MAITLIGFKKFAKIYQKETPAVKATGIVTFTRSGPGNAVIQIPQNLEIHTQNQTYLVAESDIEINESQNFVPVVCRAKFGGVAGNIERDQVWSTGLAGVTVTNSLSVFSGGKDAVPTLPSGEGAVIWTQEDDETLQSFLDTAIQNIRTKLAYNDDEAIPDAPSVDRSGYLLASYYRENRSTQKDVTQFGDDNSGLKKVRTSYYQGDRVFQALNKEVDNLLRPYVRVSAFMPDIPGESSG